MAANILLLKRLFICSGDHGKRALPPAIDRAVPCVGRIRTTVPGPADRVPPLCTATISWWLLTPATQTLHAPRVSSGYRGRHSPYQPGNRVKFLLDPKYSDWSDPECRGKTHYPGTSGLRSQQEHWYTPSKIFNLGCSQPPMLLRKA